ncbi:MAG: hypothetical protein ABR526_14270 [Chthoniobacterales bacterium]
MKRTAIIIVAAAASLFLGAANQSLAGESTYQAGGDAVIRMKHSPILGINVPVAVSIDGQQAGVFGKGHVYERALAPGPHNIVASAPGSIRSAWSGTVDVRPGETYSFVVKSTPDQLVLSPVARVD